MILFDLLDTSPHLFVLAMAIAFLSVLGLMALGLWMTAKTEERGPRVEVLRGGRR